MIDTNHKEKIEREIVETCAQALEKRELTTQDTSQVADFVLTKIDSIQNEQELLIFLGELSQKWPLFQTVIDMEKGSIQEQNEGIAINQITQNLREGKIEEAIQISQTINSNA